MMGVIRDIYGTTIEFVRTFGAFQIFFLRLIRHSPRMMLKRPRLVVKQVYNAGALSLVIIMVCGLFVGGVLGLQGYSNLARFNAEDSVGTIVAMALIKELGPVITALLFAGRAGTALSSEIGLMKATDQLSAMSWCPDFSAVQLPCRSWSPYSPASAFLAHTSLLSTF